MTGLGQVGRGFSEQAREHTLRPRPGGDAAGLSDRVALGFLVVCATASIALFALKPLPHAENWHSAPTIVAFILAIWIVYRWRPTWFATNPWVLALILVAGVVVAVMQLSTLGTNVEVIGVYRALFNALEVGRNPYDCGCIPHHVGQHALRLGNFNYPPTEIWPYYLVYSLFGVWNRLVFAGVMIALNLAACVILRLTFPDVALRVIACYFPILVFLGLTTNSATALVAVALAVLLITRRSKPRASALKEVLLAVVFSIGLLTKFVVIPVFAAYYWSKVSLRDLRSWIRSLLSVALVLGIAMLQMAPFGVVSVVRETVLFNLVLDVRDDLTTYYPNVVSGVFYWISLENLFPVVAVALLAASLLAAPTFGTHSAMVVGVITFMLVATTPEPQYLSILLYLVLAGSLQQTLEAQRSHARLLRAPPIAAAPTRASGPTAQP